MERNKNMESTLIKLSVYIYIYMLYTLYFILYTLLGLGEYFMRYVQLNESSAKASCDTLTCNFNISCSSLFYHIMIIASAVKLWRKH